MDDENIEHLIVTLPTNVCAQLDVYGRGAFVERHEFIRGAVRCNWEYWRNSSDLAGDSEGIRA